MSVLCVDRDNQDTHRRTAPTATMTTELEDILTSAEKKLVIIVENVKTLISLMYLFQNQMV